jgi:AmmeMemoRadiSam system protein B
VLLAPLLVAAAAPSQPAAPPIPSLYSDARPFDVAIAAADLHGSPGDITGLVVPHHLVAADLIAQAFRLVEGQPIDTVVVLSPDHFRRARRPFASTLRDFATVYGVVHTRRALVARLLDTPDLVEDSALFEQEHGIAAILPFLHRALPEAAIVPIAVALSSRRADWDRLFSFLAPLLRRGTLIVQSTDFSHYLTWSEAVRRDQETLSTTASGNLDAVAALRQPDHIDSVGAYYLQLRLQREVFGSGPIVLFNRNMQQYEVDPQPRTTSYVVEAFSRTLDRRVALEVPGSRRLCFAGDTFLGRDIARILADPAMAARLRSAFGTLLGHCRLVVNLDAVPGALILAWLHDLNVVAAGMADDRVRDLGADADMLRAAGIEVISDSEVADLGDIRLLALSDLDRPLDRDQVRGLAASVTAPPLFALIRWGTASGNAPGPREQLLADDLQQGGAAAIIGSHPRIATHAIGLVRGSWTPLVYSLGKFVSGSGAVLEVRLFRQGTFALRLVPVPDAMSVLGSAAIAPSSEDGSRSGRPAGNSAMSRRPGRRSPGSDDATISVPPD